MKKAIRILIFCFCLAVIFTLCFAFISCKKTAKEESPAVETNVKEVTRYHKWYYFSDTGIQQIDKPQNVPLKSFLPWTEAVRISSSNNTSGAAAGDYDSFALVNRAGMLCFNGNTFTLKNDINLFEDRTAGNLVFFNDTPIFSVYKSSFFNNTISDPLYRADDSQHFFLVQFDVNTGLSYPIINCGNITKLSDTEVVDYSWDGRNFLCCLKTVNENRVGFSYVKWTPSAPLLSLTPASADENIVLADSNEEAFRNTKKPLESSVEAPARMKKLFAGFSNDIPFSIEIKTAGGYSNRKYVNSVPNSDKKELKASAIISESWSAALFEDGTFFIEGALPGKHILRGGKPVAIRLPKLPPRFVYSDFVISGTTLYAAWEESDFFKTNRSGFLALDLDATLYK